MFILTPLFAQVQILCTFCIAINLYVHKSNLCALLHFPSSMHFYVRKPHHTGRGAQEGGGLRMRQKLFMPLVKGDYSRESSESCRFIGGRSQGVNPRGGPSNPDPTVRLYYPFMLG